MTSAGDGIQLSVTDNTNLLQRILLLAHGHTRPLQSSTAVFSE